MTTTLPDPVLVALDALKQRAQADPAIATSKTRIDRIGVVVSLLIKGAADCTPAQRYDVQALLAPDTVGHPDQENSILGRAVDGRYRNKPPYQPLTAATRRYLMDGLADLNRTAGHAPYWWEQRGMRPWSKHTKVPLQADGHRVLRRALCEPAAPHREPFRLRTLVTLEMLWDTGVPPEGLAAADTTDLAPDLSTVELTVNPPGRTEAIRKTFRLTANTRGALKLWLPVRRAVVTEHLSAGADDPHNQALVITLHPTVGTYEDGSPRLVPPGLRISEDGLKRSCAQWLRWLNETHKGQAGWPVPTTLQTLSRGGAEKGRSRR